MKESAQSRGEKRPEDEREAPAKTEENRRLNRKEEEEQPAAERQR